MKTFIKIVLLYNPRSCINRYYNILQFNPNRVKPKVFISSDLQKSQIPSITNTKLGQVKSTNLINNNAVNRVLLSVIILSSKLHVNIISLIHTPILYRNQILYIGKPSDLHMVIYYIWYTQLPTLSHSPIGKNNIITNSALVNSNKRVFSLLKVLSYTKVASQGICDCFDLNAV